MSSRRAACPGIAAPVRRRSFGFVVPREGPLSPTGLSLNERLDENFQPGAM